MDDDEKTALQRLPTAIARPADTARSRYYAGKAKSSNTRAAYQNDWQRFERWCETMNVPALPAHPETIAEYFARCADEGKKCATILRSASVIAQAHLAAGFPSPRTDARVQAVLRGVRNHLTVAQRRVKPILLEDLRGLVGSLAGSPLVKARNRALLLVGFAGAFRRSELVGLCVEDLERVERGYLVTLRRSKTDQAGHGAVKALPLGKTELCPVRALEEWLAAGQIEKGHVFRSVGRRAKPSTLPMCAAHVAIVIKQACAACGMDPALYSGHSLRAGLVTQAAREGAADIAIMRQTGHSSVNMLHRYNREGDIWRDNPATIAGM